jgi:membrane dipeptidase
MSRSRRPGEYRSYAYLEPGRDYRAFHLANEVDRVSAHPVPLTPEQQRRVEALADRCIMVSLHEHLGTFPARIDETPAYVREGRVATAFEGLARCWWDVVLDNLLDGICTIESKSGWKWNDVLHDLGMRLCDLAHQDGVVHVTTIEDIHRARHENRLAWIASMEGAAMIENELDRIDLLYGFGVRALGITYSESNALGSGLREPRDGGLTVFGRRAVERMNRVGMLIDCSHCGDQTTLDVIEASEKPIVLSHIGARALWDSNRLAPDDVLIACARKGGVIGIEAAPHTTITRSRRRHDLDAFMEHFEYIVDLVGIDHVGFGPDTLYGDHVGLHHTYAANLSIRESRAGRAEEGGAQGQTPRVTGGEFEQVAYVEGIENPTEGSHNILRWLVSHNYNDNDIEKVIGANAMRLLADAWAR